MHLGVAHTTKAQRTANAVRLLRSLNPKAKRRKIPRKAWPMNAERDYARELRALTIRAVAPPLTRVVQSLPALVQQARAARVDARRPATALQLSSLVVVRADAGEARALVDRAYREMMAGLEVRDIANLANRYARSVSGHNLKQLGRQLSAAFGVDVSIPDVSTPRTIDAFIDQNVSLVLDNVERFVGSVEKDITRILASTRIDMRSDARQSLPAASNVRLIVRRPADMDVHQLAAAITRNVALGGTNAELAEEIERRFDFAADHAEIIARDQVGKLNGQLDAQRQQNLGIKRFIWRTVGDERVRDEHEERDGETYDYDDPPDGELPGEPINCRCSAEPVFDDIFDDL